VKRTQCPKCHEAGNDTKGDNLVVFPDGHKHCFACGYHEQNGAEYAKSKKTQFRSPENAPCTAVPNHSCITAETLKAFYVRCKVTTSANGAARVIKTHLYYPYFKPTSAGESVLVGYKARDYRQDKDYGTYAVEGSELTLFGLNTLKGKSTLLLCEGEPDTLAAWQCFHKNADVLGLAGAQHTDKLKKFRHILDKYKRYILLFDPDAAGDDAAEKTADILPEYKLWKAQLEYDVCDTIERVSAVSLAQSVKKAVKVATSNVVSSTELSEEYMKHLTQSHYSGYDTGFDGLNRMLGGDLKPAETLMFVAHSGRGKSTFVLNMAYNMAHLSKAKILWVSTEMLYVSMVHKALECDLGDVLSYVDGKLNVPYEDLEDSLDFISKHFVFYNGEMSISSIEEAVYEAIAVHDISVLVIDVLNDIDGVNDWQRASDIMKTFNKLANGDLREKRKPLAVILVTHTTKRDGKYAKSITLSDISGGGQFVRRATCIVAMNGELDKRRRYLDLVKLPRMGVAEATSCEVVYDVSERFYKEVQV
jgi:archaellum biogenesis ATPase FlaH/5S rRNA maturation endonuclease (ribonuclease M5)